MEHYAGIDVSLEQSSVCVVNGQGKIVREGKVTSEPEAVMARFRALTQTPARIGLEAGPLSQWLHAGLTAAGFEVVLLETRHVKGKCQLFHTSFLFLRRLAAAFLRFAMRRRAYCIGISSMVSGSYSSSHSAISA